MANLKVGDVVHLKSGSPQMTVTKTDNLNGPKISCSWFVKSDGPFKDNFPEDSLSEPEN